MSAEVRPLLELDEDAALRAFLLGTAAETGERFFRALVEALLSALNTDGAWVTEYLPEQRKLRALAFYLDGQWVEDYEFELSGTPCETVIEGRALVHFPDRLIDLYPGDADLRARGMVSYLGLPLLDEHDRVLGHMSVVDRRPLPRHPRIVALFRLFAERAAAELRRLRAEQSVRDREEKLTRLVDSAMDAILELDHENRVSMASAAAVKLFGCGRDALLGTPLERLFAPEEGRRVAALIDQLDALPAGERCLWIPGQLQAQRADGTLFTVEGTLSRYELARRRFHTLILRDVDDRIAAENRIRLLTEEAQYLRHELQAAQNFGEILGRSAALLRVLRDVEQVARTDATVLIQGETGTGKELIARAIHDASHRCAQPLIKVNCAAIPASLIESEFFGHEKGAFTGATVRRDGRFALANGGTIFLDEVGELPLDLQGKLLRVLQEGEFEPVGSSRTQRVDVRVLSATNRDLKEAVARGNFREDLYYRLHVFPLSVPPLRERGDDVLLLAESFARKCAERMGRRVAPLSEQDRLRLSAYSWPGNVRELQNVIERAVITSENGRLNLQRALPNVEAAARTAPCDAIHDADRVRTAEEMLQLERDNIVRALVSTGWRIAGTNGAATLLGLRPSTLSSRIKALGIRRPE